MKFLLQLAFDCALIPPLVVFLFQAVSHWCCLFLQIRIPERIFSRLTILGFLFSGASANVGLILLLSSDNSVAELLTGSWYKVHAYSFRWSFIADELSFLMCMLVSALVSLIAVFSRRYLHEEPGFHRFYILLSLFGFGSLCVVCAGNLEVIFFGWELIGLSSALLIAFYNDRIPPLMSSLRTYITYRICDIGLLGAILILHVTHAQSAFQAIESAWWYGLVAPEDSSLLLITALCIIVAAVGKSALYPLGDWLPRAMEGPTPSSAIFYGAISVHLGVFLLLRSVDLFAGNLFVSGILVTLGVLTAGHATFVGRVQTDIKSILAYSSMTQVGIIVLEIGLGWYTLAVIHLFGNALLRTLQILQAPNILHDRQHLEQAMGKIVPSTGAHLERVVPKAIQPWLYRLALERGSVDTVLYEFLLRPFLRSATQAMHIEEKITAFLLGKGRK